MVSLTAVAILYLTLGFMANTATAEEANSLVMLRDEAHILWICLAAF